MTRRTFFTGLLVIVAAVLAKAAERTEANPSSPAAATTNATNFQVIAYYFHGTLRCETCLKIERQAREVIERRFKSELTAKQMVFKPVNYDLPENAHCLQDYKLPCPSLVLVCRKNAKDEKWKLLGKTWQLAADATKFDRYVEEEVGEYLRDTK